MTSGVPSVCLLVPLMAAAGCGPMQQPMPPRLGGDGQKQIDEAWEKALTPVGRLNRQQWLDAFVLTQAYQIGVDRLSFRSEKEFSGGTVVMEIHFDRCKPGEDRFEVTVLDRDGKPVRAERYSRADVEGTCEVFSSLPPPDPNEPPELTRKRREREAREKVIEQFFPPLKGVEPAGNHAGRP